MAFDLVKYKHIDVAPLTGVIGAEISGVNIGEPLTECVADEIVAAFNEFNVIFFRDQDLNEEKLGRFAEIFGELGISHYAHGTDAHPLITRFRREAETSSDVRNIGDRWHSDGAGDVEPSKGFVLYNEECPPYGGDTMFASMTAAYKALPETLKEICKGLVGVYSSSAVFDLTGRDKSKKPYPLSHRGAASNETAIADDVLNEILKEVEHPLVCTHAETGEPYLYVAGHYLMHFKGMTDKESAPLIAQLNEHAIRPEFSCRFRWRKGSVAVLDNRCTLHYAINDYAGFARQMLRAELRGSAPIGFSASSPNDAKAAASI